MYASRTAKRKQSFCRLSSSSLPRDAAKIANKVGRVLRPADVSCTESTHAGEFIEVYNRIYSRVYVFFLAMVVSILVYTAHATK